MGKGKSVKKNATKKQAPKNPRQQFNAYCQVIQQQHLRLDKLHQQQAELVARFQQQLLPLERQYIDIVYQKTERLLSFINKKSLPAYQRDALLQWITEEIIYLDDYPFSEHLDLEALKEQHLKACAAPIGQELDKNELQILREILGEEFPFVYQIPDEEFLDLAHNPKKFKARVEQEFLDSIANESEESEDDEDPFIEEPEHQATAARQRRQQEMTALFSASAANRMYKQLAKVFHPDREMDEGLKQDKHHLMVQLAQAKQNHDIWAIISLYQEHIDPDGGFAEKDLLVINQLLAEQVESLKFDYRRREHECDPLTSLLWEKFGDSKTPQSLDKKLIRHAKDLQIMIEGENEMLTELTSLKALKGYLAQRAQEMEEEMSFMFRYS